MRKAAATITFSPGGDGDSSSLSSTSSTDSLHIIAHPTQEHNVTNNNRQNNSEEVTSVLNNNASESIKSEQCDKKERTECDEGTTRQCDTVHTVNDKDSTTHCDSKETTEQSRTQDTTDQLNPPSPDKPRSSPTRFNPFDKEEYDPNQKLFPQADSSIASCPPMSGTSSSGSSDQDMDMAISEDHFGLPEVSAYGLNMLSISYSSTMNSISFSMSSVQ